MTGRLERVKAALRSSSEVCSLDDLYPQALSNGRNDVSDLILKHGWVIDKWWTSHGTKKNHKHYALRYDPERQPVQLVLA